MGESSGVGFSTSGLQKGDLRYNVNDGITYQYIGGSAQYVDMWLRKNGVDIPNTGVRNTVTAASDTKVLVLNWVGELLIGDIIDKYIAVSAAGVGLGLYTFTNSVGPIIPAGIFSIAKIQ